MTSAPLHSPAGAEVRICEVCGSDDYERLHIQQFFVVGEDLPFHYTVSACRRCGFLLADDIPSQQEYERYYKNNLRYTYNRGDIPEGIRTLHRRAFRFIDEYLVGARKMVDPKSFSILDIGCSTGHFLHVLKQNGYPDVLGIEPAPECSSLAQDLYGIRVISSPLSGFASSSRFNLMIMSGVLEHLCDLAETLSTVSSLLEEGGTFFTLVPDAMGFSMMPKEPFHEFSPEHINFFTSSSIGNLMGKFGLIRKREESWDVDLYDSRALATIWEKSATTECIAKDREGPRKLKEYIAASEQRMGTVRAAIDALVESGEEIVVWGGGSLTGRLLASTRLREANIRAIVDSNEGLHGKTIGGIAIGSPEMLTGSATTVFVSSHVYGHEIALSLEKRRHRGRVILL